ncbi:hypothetical protein B0T17DRAFT_636400 [Bombardia bombarda]|uniref:Uncharacterized protein n=1 Tax=Bombardia bombarda TaxID=252184 RepID=A0AA40CAD5_9PEZI|nr:hypothetical protein B0T17DRAFT_636400 [Bombardia bombarda]
MICTPFYSIKPVDFILNGTKARSIFPALQDTHASSWKMESVSASDILAAHHASYKNEDLLYSYEVRGQWMAGLLIACIILSLLHMLTVPWNGILPCSPVTAAGIASIISNSPGLISKLQLAGAADEVHFSKLFQDAKFKSDVVIHSAFGQSIFMIQDNEGEVSDKNRGISQARCKNSYPGVLRPALRSTLCLVLVMSLATLELLLHKSTEENGIGNVGSDDAYIHYTWTTIPALVLGLVGMVNSSVDSSTRCLAPYIALKKKAVGAELFATFDFLDISTIRAIYKEIKVGDARALATTLALLGANWFTIFSASLFQERSIPTVLSVTLQADQSFSTYTDRDFKDSTTTSSLLLNANLSFPKLTYEDLAFPHYTIMSNLASETAFKATSTISIKSTVPALRANFNCRAYDSTKISTKITLNYTIADIYPYYDTPCPNPLTVKIDDEVPTISYRTILYFGVIFCTNPNATYFGGYKPIFGYSSHIFIWGRINYQLDPIVRHVAAASCNITMETVDIETTFLNITDLRLDPRNPPKPLEHTVRQSTRVVIGSQASYSYLDLAVLDTGSQSLDPFFASLTTSPWALPIQRLGGNGDDDGNDTNASIASSFTENDEAVLSAIKFHSGIMWAQIASSLLIPADQTNTTFTKPQPGENDAQRRYNATMTDSAGRRRVIQDAVSTRVLEALLLFVLAMVLLSWVVIGDMAVLASSPTSIAAVGALVAGGNLIDMIKDGKTLDEQGKGMKFWLGWGRVGDEENENGASRFGIFAIREEDMDIREEDMETGGEDGENGLLDKGKVGGMQVGWRRRLFGQG